MGRVREVSINKARAGMILAGDIISEDRQLLLRHGFQLTSKNISDLKKRSVHSIKIMPQDKLSVRGPHATPGSITNQTDYNVFYQEAVQAIKAAFQATLFNKRLSLHVINKLVESHIGPLINARGSLAYLQRVQVHCEYTYRHSINVAILSGILGKLACMTKEKLQDLVLAGLLHDIGKISISMDILNKPGKLTVEEMVVIKTHAYGGYELLLPSGQIAEEIRIGVLQHHERNDGSGYPLGLTGSQISKYAKIIAIADIYDAMTSDRIYRKKLTPFHVAETIVQQMYKQLDPELCLKFLRHITNCLANSTVLLSTGQEAKVVYQHEIFAAKPVVKLSDGTCLDLEKNREIAIISVAN